MSLWSFLTSALFPNCLPSFSLSPKLSPGLVRTFPKHHSESFVAAAHELPPSRSLSPLPDPGSHHQNLEISSNNNHSNELANTNHESNLSHDGEPAPPASCFGLLLDQLTAALKAVLPRRCHEPTGPVMLLLDMLLSLFVSCGASRSTINQLPLYTVRRHCEAGKPHPREQQQQQQQCECIVQAPESQSQNTLLLQMNRSEKCAICLAPFEDGDTVRKLVCLHVFHTECVDAWLQKKSLCPVCKADPC